MLVQLKSTKNTMVNVKVKNKYNYIFMISNKSENNDWIKYSTKLTQKVFNRNKETRVKLNTLLTSISDWRELVGLNSTN